MYFLLVILMVAIPLLLVQWAYMKWVGVTKEATHHKSSDYVDEAFKMNFIQGKVNK
ncbi:hypothetical protein [Turicibacter sanguinis]|uniref:hypothetical protein n=1 Tax=Turicibacter sanguinis TaxID=154288 RepID=UPI00241CEE40|nr:hypothetical protein [Turicibacter sanguinis]